MWADDDTQFSDARIIFIDTEESNWTFDPVRRQFFWHRFFSHQPDLNYENPAVQEAILNVARFWARRGIDGFRLDAVPYLKEREGTNNENLPETHEVLKRIRAEIDRRYADRMLLAEANQWPEDVRDYFGDGDECHMAYHFPLLPRITRPTLVAHELAALDPADLTQMAGEVAGFLLPKEARASLPA